MKLYIDTSDSERIIVGVDDERFETQAREEKSQRLLPFIDEILRKKGKSLEDIKAIEVSTGPGSFTGLRVGLSVANTLGFALGVPVNGRNLNEEESVDINYE